MRTIAKIRNLMLAAALASVAMLGADVSGKWKGSMPGRDGNTRDVSFNFKADGSKLSGTMMGPMGRETEISDGKVDGDNISFNVKLDLNGTAMTIVYTGKVKGEEIDMKSQREGAPRSTEFTVKTAGS
jgi:hypothetical protein